MSYNGFCRGIVILALTNFCGPFNPYGLHPVLIPGHTAKYFNFARCQRFLIKSKNTIPAFRGSWGDQYVPGRARHFFAPLPSLCYPANRASRTAYGLVTFAFFLKKKKIIKTPQCCMSFNGVKCAVFTCIPLRQARYFCRIQQRQSWLHFLAIIPYFLGEGNDCFPPSPSPWLI